MAGAPRSGSVAVEHFSDLKLNGIYEPICDGSKIYHKRGKEHLRLQYQSDYQHRLGSTQSYSKYASGVKRRTLQYSFGDDWSNDWSGVTEFLIPSKDINQIILPELDWELDWGNTDWRETINGIESANVSAVVTKLMFEEY